MIKLFPPNHVLALGLFLVLTSPAVFAEGGADSNPFLEEGDSISPTGNALPSLKLPVGQPVAAPTGTIPQLPPQVPTTSNATPPLMPTASSPSQPPSPVQASMGLGTPMPPAIPPVVVAPESVHPAGSLPPQLQPESRQRASLPAMPTTSASDPNPSALLDEEKPAPVPSVAATPSIDLVPVATPPAAGTSPAPSAMAATNPAPASTAAAGTATPGAATPATAPTDGAVTATPATPAQATAAATTCAECAGATTPDTASATDTAGAKPNGAPKLLDSSSFPEEPSGPEVAIILSNNRFYPAAIRLKRGQQTRLIFTTVNRKPAALVIERLQIQKWVAKEDHPIQMSELERARWEMNRELSTSRITEIMLNPANGYYTFHDALTGAHGDILVE